MTVKLPTNKRAQSGGPFWRTDSDDIGVSNIGHGRRGRRGVCCLRRLANVPQYTTHTVCGAGPAVGRSGRALGEVRSEIGILIACAILLAEIKATLIAI